MESCPKVIISCSNFKGYHFSNAKKVYLKFIAQKYLGDFFSEIFSNTFAFFYIISRFNQCKNFLQHFYKNFRLLTLIFDLSPLFFNFSHFLNYRIFNFDFSLNCFNGLTSNKSRPGTLNSFTSLNSLFVCCYLSYSVCEN